MKDFKVQFQSVVLAVRWLISAGCRQCSGAGGPWDGWTWVSSAPFRRHRRARLRQQRSSSSPREGCSPRRTHFYSPCAVWGPSIQHTNTSKQVQSTASASKDWRNPFPRKATGKSTVIAAYNCTETELDSDSQQKNKNLWYQGKF